MNLGQFLLHLFGKLESEETILRCLNKATCVIYDSKNILVCDDEWIYFYGTILPTNKNSYKFYSSVKHLMVGKKLVRKNTRYNKRIVKEGDYFIWLG